MVRKAFRPEQIINRLREAEVLLSQGATIGEATEGWGSRSRPTTAGARSTAA